MPPEQPEHHQGSMGKWLSYLPVTQETRVQFPLEPPDRGVV